MQGQTPFILAKYILHNPKMVELLKSFRGKTREPCSGVEAPEEMFGTDEDQPTGADSLQNISDKSDGAALGCVKARIRRTAVVSAVTSLNLEQQLQQQPQEKMSTGTTNKRPYLFREAKVLPSRLDNKLLFKRILVDFNQLF